MAKREHDPLALPRMHEFVEGLADLDELTHGIMRLQRFTIRLPVEVEIANGAKEGVAIGLGPPTQYTETSVMPVFHEIGVTISVSASHDGEA
jgi:hypothetical protein